MSFVKHSDKTVVKTIALSLCLAGLLLLILHAGWPDNFSFKDFTAWIQQVPASILIIVFLLAPLLGLPFSAFLIAIGIAFPPAAAVGLTVAAMLVHHVLVYALSKTSASIWLQRHLVQRKLVPHTRAGHTLSDNAFFVATAAWVPGLSYIFKLAYTALAGVPFRTYLIAGTVAQLIGALPFLVLGEAAEQGGLAWVGVILFALIVLSWVAKHYLLGRKMLAAAETHSLKD